MKKLLVVLLGLMIALPALAAELKGGYAACVSEEAFYEFIDAMVKEDKRGMNYLINNSQCVVTTPGVNVSVLDRGWGVTKVRAYGENHAIVLWTNSENIVD